MAEPEMNNSNSPRNQDLVKKIHEHEAEIMQLKKRLAAYSIKEAQIRHENYVLEKHIAELREAFDKRQQDQADAESKAFAYRQDIIEENVRLTYGLQDAQQERLTYVSSLLPLLAKNSLEPPDQDAWSIVSNVKVLFKHLREKRVRTEDENRIELVPQPGADWDILGRHRDGLAGSGGAANNVDTDELGRQITSKSSIHGVPTRMGLTIRRPGSSNEGVNGHGGDANQNGRGITSKRGSDDDPLPAIEDLQILGEAFPGRELQACGYSINGTSSCNFEWIRHFDDGSVNFIDGAVQPNYLITADDVDTYLAVEVLPVDDRNRKGESVKVFANDKKKITCAPEMQSYIEKTLYSGHASYKVSLSIGYLDIWEPATLAIKRDGYSIKCSGPRGVVVTENFSPSISVLIPYGHVSEFVLICSSGVELLLRTENSSTDVSGLRDTIVLIVRLFILRAEEKRRGRKGLLLNK